MRSRPSDSGAAVNMLKITLVKIVKFVIQFKTTIMGNRKI